MTWYVCYYSRSNAANVRSRERESDRSRRDRPFSQPKRDSSPPPIKRVKREGLVVVVVVIVVVVVVVVVSVWQTVFTAQTRRQSTNRVKHDGPRRLSLHCRKCIHSWNCFLFCCVWQILFGISDMPVLSTQFARRSYVFLLLFSTWDLPISVGRSPWDFATWSEIGCVL